MALLETVDLGKEFVSGESRLRVFGGINIQVEAGESIAIVGPSGSGKSTLLGILAGLDRPTQGTVSLNGRDLATLSESRLSKIWGKEVGFIFQSYYLLPALNALENVIVPLEFAGEKNAEEKAKMWLEKVGLGERLDHLPSKLSGGEQQRVALARALAPEPKLLFADEPTGNLDLKTAAGMMDLIFSLVNHNGTALVIVTHEMDFAKRAGRVLDLKDGKFI